MTTETFTTTNKANVSFFSYFVIFSLLGTKLYVEQLIPLSCVGLESVVIHNTILWEQKNYININTLLDKYKAASISFKLQIKQVRFYHNCCKISCTRPWLLPNDLKSFSCKFLPQCHSKSFRSAHYSPNMDNSSLGIYFLDCSYLVPCLHMLWRRKKSVLQNLDIVLIRC